MNDSLTILLPVHNAEKCLAGNVEAALEIAGELTPRCEVAVVDDGSTDRTEEIACDLAIRYPQVIVARHPQPRGRSAAIETGMAATTGWIVLVQPQELPLQAAELRRLWHVGIGFQPASDAAIAADSSGRQLRPAGVIARLVAWGQASRQAQQAAHGVQLIRRGQYAAARPALGQLAGRVDRPAAVLLPPSASALVRARDAVFSE